MGACRGEGEEKERMRCGVGERSRERGKKEEERRFLKTQRYPPSLSCGPPHQEHV